MSLYKITVLTIQFTFFFQTETLFKCEFVLDASKFWFISLWLLCCNMTGRDCIFVLILDNSDKKHVFLFFFFFFKTDKNRKGKTKKQTKNRRAEQSFLLSPDLSSRWGKKATGISACVASLVTAVAAEQLPICASALSEHSPLSFEGWHCHQTSPFGGCCPHARGRWMEKVEWQVWGVHSLLC